jgi:hypothetical protein
MKEKITFEKFISKEEILSFLKKVEFRGLYDKDGNKLQPYAKSQFSLVTIHPPLKPTSFPRLLHNFQSYPLFTAQPTIYKTQTDILAEVEDFLNTLGKQVNTLKIEGVQYDWEGRGRYHVLPPIIEKHSYPLRNGSFDLKKMSENFKGTFVKDAKGNMHELSKRVLRDYFVDQESKVKHLDMFNHNAELLNYGLRFNGKSDFHIVCDGSHRIDLALEKQNRPINAILVEGPLLPYYAFPMPFRPAIRLTSKEAEKMYPQLGLDKVHLFNHFLKKVLHYDWKAGGLHVSKLRSKPTIH